PVRGELMISRRAFLETLSAAAVLPAWTGQSASPNEWGSPVFDLHFHMRPQPAANVAHLDGAGIAKANLLTRATAAEQVAAIDAVAPKRFTWLSSADITKPEAGQALTAAVKAGARGFGELQLHVAADGPELRRS